MIEHFNNMRSYAMGDEKALLMASWPNGGRPKIPFPYWSEVMTGFEYTAAMGILYEGMEQEGLDVIKNIRDRYDGQRRKPFDEAECGHHYARAMASWAGIIQQSDFRYSGVDKTIRFTTKEGNYFWSNGSSRRMCEIYETEKSYQVCFSVNYGTIELKNFALGEHISEDLKQGIILKENESVKFELKKRI